MATTEKTPLWLELKKEYIDDNFAALQSYLRNSTNKDDAFYQTTIDLFRERISDLLVSISDSPIYDDDEDRQQLSSRVNMLATYLLADGAYSLALPAYVAFMNGLRILNPRFSESIVRTVFQRLCHERVSCLGFSWDQLEKIGTDLFVHNLCEQARFESPLSKPMMYSGWGTAVLSSKGIMLTHDTKDVTKKLLKDGTNSMDTGFGITLRTSSADKLKQSLSDSVVDMDEYTKDFVLQQARVKRQTETPVLRHYSDGDEVIVKITAIGRNVQVSTIDPAYATVQGLITYQRSSLVYYYTDELYRYFHVGDYLTATITDAERGVFNIEKQLVRFFVEDTRQMMDSPDSYTVAMLIDERPNYSTWLTETGVAVRTNIAEDYNRGDFAKISIHEYATGQQYGIIRGHVIGMADDDFEEETARHDCIRAFAESTEAPVYAKPEEETKELSPVLLRLLLRLLFDYQKSLLKPSDRFRCLANANIIAEMVGDNLSASYISFARTYLRALIQFVNGESLSGITLEPDAEYKEAKSTLIRLSIIELLKEYGRKDNSEKLAKTISDFQETLPELARLARLIQTANSMLDILSSPALNVIHREIVRLLSLETESETDLEADRGIYLGVESGTLEFKTSIVFPPNNNMQPDEYTQNLNVMKGICAFLNSTTGGTLYLGVNDQGYVVGVENDMHTLKTQTIDAYQRYVQDVAKKYFGVDALPYLRIEPLYDNRVVAIHVDPHPYRVVELNGEAYLRVNAESRVMPDQLRLETIDRKVFANKDRAAAVSHLQHACAQKRCAVLHNYASNNGGNITDRHVEPYDVRPEDGLVVCYDLDRSAPRVFSFNRIGYVEILADKPWTHTAQHKSMTVDVFHMTGDAPVTISLQLNLMAKNLLVEEYPRAKDFVKGDKSDPNIWYFSAPICSMAGIGRFYLGLAEHIQILDGEPLKKYSAEYVTKNFK